MIVVTKKTHIFPNYSWSSTISKKIDLLSFKVIAMYSKAYHIDTVCSDNEVVMGTGVTKNLLHCVELFGD